jgi:leader peptidase (prepilin peptidase)/N-methyltransferase
MGGGDIKLLAMIGAFLGWQNALVTLVLGSLGGALIGIVLVLVRGDNSRVPIPFGPFLALAALCALLFGDPLVHWYLHLAMPS